MQIFRITIIVALIFSSLFVNAQDAGYQNGFIVTNQNDTIHGLIKYKNTAPYRVLEKIKFKRTKEEKDESYSPDEIKGFTIDTVTFISKLTKATGTSERRFLKPIVMGALSYYELEHTGFGAGNITEYIILEKKDASEQLTYVVNSLGFNFKKKMSEYVKEVPGLSDKISSGAYTKKDLKLIVTEYNKVMGNN